MPSQEPVQEVVDILSEALAKAKSGKLTGVAVVMVERDPEAFDVAYHSHASRYTLAAGALVLNWKLGERMSGS